MSDSFYIAVASSAGAFFAMIPAGILAWATLVKVRQLRDDTATLKTEMNGHMTKVLEITAAKGLAEGELKGRADKSAEVLSATIREEGRKDAKAEVLIGKIKNEVNTEDQAEVFIKRKNAKAKKGEVKP